MKDTGRELTVSGFNKVMELDTNGNGKIEEAEVKIEGDLEGNDYSVNNNCIGCSIWNCYTTFSCVHGVPRPSIPTRCWPGWTEFQGQCYKFFDQKVVWSDARAYCMSLQVIIIIIMIIIIIK